MKYLIGALLSLISSLSYSQGLSELTLGKVTRADLAMKSYPRDSTAGAVFLDERGQAYFSNAEHAIIFERYLKIKILKKSGLHQADFNIPLYKNGNQVETKVSLEASTFNMIDGVRKEDVMTPQSVFLQKDRDVDRLKFTLPNVREGSVIEVVYKINSPFIFNFKTWWFQSEIPKVHSEYWALIPGNYFYNISLRGFYKLGKNESELVRECFTPGGADKADCSLLKYGMDNIPAFEEEEHMTARGNFISSIRFELEQVKRFDGVTTKVTEEWKDVDLRLRQHDDFGSQLRKAKKIFDDKIPDIIHAETDPQKKARLIYDFIKSWYTWDHEDGLLADLGARKAYDTRKGNAADINIALVGALQAADLNALAVILSTRDNGLPGQLFPVLSEFNYVIASVNIGGKEILLDATDPLQPFGFLPMHCLNGSGRLMAKESAWIELKPKDKKKKVTALDLTMMPDGTIEGRITINSEGYEAFDKRQEILAAGDSVEYRKKLQDQWKEIEIEEYHIENLRNLDAKLIEKMLVKFSFGAMTAQTVYFNPFLLEKIDENPFKATERLYPVDFGVPTESVLSLSLSLTSYQIDELPSPVAIALPQGGGRYLYNVSSANDRVTATSMLSINKAVYNSAEYHYLKELFARIVQVNQSQIVLKKK